MNTPYDQNLPIEQLINHIEEATKFFDILSSPYTPTQTVNIGFHFIKRYTYLSSTIKMESKLAADKMAYYKILFQEIIQNVVCFSTNNPKRCIPPFSLL